MPYIAQIIGIDVAATSPAEALSNDQLQALNKKLIPTVAIHGVSYGGLKHDPPRLKFEVVLRLALRRSGIIDNGGFTDDGCTGSPIGCTWGEYCSCFQSTHKEEFIAKGGDPSYPDERFFQGDDDPVDFTPLIKKEKTTAAKFEPLPFEEKMHF